MTSDESLQLPRKYCILCVDDDLIGLELRAALLEEEGYSVTAVSCPLMALEYDVSKFHMAILDFAMPVLNGFQLLLRLRAARASFPIVLLTGMSQTLPNDVRSVLKLPRQRRTDTSFAEHRALLSDFDPGSTGVQRCSSPAS